MGGALQPQQHVQIFLNLVEFGMNETRRSYVSTCARDPVRWDSAVDPQVDQLDYAFAYDSGSDGFAARCSIMFSMRTVAPTPAST